MGMCKPSGGIKSKVGGVGDLKIYGVPNTRIDLYDENDELIQQRWYGPDGRVIWDRDWKHGGGEHEWPHDHYWDWLDPNHPGRHAYIGPNGEKTNINYC